MVFSEGELQILSPDIYPLVYCDGISKSLSTLYYRLGVYFSITC